MMGENRGFDEVEIVACTGNRGLSPVALKREKF